MRPGEADRVLALLEVYWPNAWSPRNSNASKQNTKDELDDMFKDYRADDVLKMIRKLGRETDKTPSYSLLLKRMADEYGRTTEDGLNYRWEQYVYQVFEDEYGREYAKTCNVKIFNDGSFELPKGVPYNERMLRKCGIISKPAPEKDSETDEIPAGFQVMIDDIFKDW